MRWAYIIILAILPLSGFSQWRIELDGGIALAGYNDARIPGKGGNLFSLSNELNASPVFSGRLEIFRKISEKSTLRFIAAPLHITAKGNINRDIKFLDKTFTSGKELEADFVFNSYRVSYLYQWMNKDKWQSQIGFTAKLRQAKISLKSNTLFAEKPDLGFVPIIYFALQYKYNDFISAEFNVDALGAKQGRAEDAYLGLKFHANKNLGINTGYRILEGGADVESVYTFSLTHIFTFGVSITIQ